MGLELIFKPEKIEKKPYLMFFYAILFSSLAVFLSFRIFPGYASIILVTFTVIPLVPIVVRIMEVEETKYEHIKHIFKRHNLFKIYAFMTLGLILSYSAWYFFLPPVYSDHVFKSQIEALYDLEPPLVYLTDIPLDTDCDMDVVKRHVIGQEVSKCKVMDFGRDQSYEYLIFTDDVDRPSYIYLEGKDRLDPYRSHFWRFITLNNMEIALFIFFTSFIFGAGALFIIVWNASVVGVFMGEAARMVAHPILEISPVLGRISAYFTSLPISLSKLAFHGVFEFTGFFCAALSGGLLSVAIIKHGYFDKKFKVILKDSLIFLFASIFLIAFAAIIEVN